MPLHVQPILRAREEHLEVLGYIKTLNSAGLLTVKSDEDAGKRAKQVPVAYTTIFTGNKKTAS